MVETFVPAAPKARGLIPLLHYGLNVGIIVRWIIQLYSISSCRHRVDSTALRQFTNIAATGIDHPQPVSHSHSYIVTMSTHRVKEKMLQLQNALFYRLFS